MWWMVGESGTGAGWVLDLQTGWMLDEQPAVRACVGDDGGRDKVTTALQHRHTAQVLSDSGQNIFRQQKKIKW